MYLKNKYVELSDPVYKSILLYRLVVEDTKRALTYTHYIQNYSCLHFIKYFHKCVHTALYTSWCHSNHLHDVNLFREHYLSFSTFQIRPCIKYRQNPYHVFSHSRASGLLSTQKAVLCTLLFYPVNSVREQMKLAHV